MRKTIILTLVAGAIGVSIGVYWSESTRSMAHPEIWVPLANLPLSCMAAGVVAGLFVFAVAGLWRRIFGITSQTWRTHGKVNNQRWW